MAKYSPFAEKAGMRKVAEQSSVEGIKLLIKLNPSLKSLSVDRQSTLHRN
jgi:hypothetical protein